MKKVSRYEEKKNREKRAFAALHCVHYQECLDKAAKSNKRLECHKCEMFKIVPDSYQKEMNVAAFNNQNADEQSIKVEHFQCKTGVTDINRQSSKQGKKIMEEHSGQKSEVEDQKPGVETQICQEKDCEHGGEPRPIDDFQIHGRSKTPGVRIKTCKSCMIKKRLAGKQKRLEKEMAQDQKPEINPKKMKNQLKLQEETHVDFLKTLLDGLPKVLENINKIAADQERTPEAQVRYFLKTDDRIIKADDE